MLLVIFEGFSKSLSFLGYTPYGIRLVLSFQSLEATPQKMNGWLEPKQHEELHSGNLT